MLKQTSKLQAFTLVEVVLAIAVMSLAVVALLGLLVPTLGSVRSVIDTSQATAAMTKFNAHLDNAETFDTLFTTVEEGGEYFVYEVLRTGGGGTEIRITDNRSEVNSDYAARDIVGPVFRFHLSRSSLWSGTSSSNWNDIDEQAYFPIFVRVLLAEPESTDSSTPTFRESPNTEYIERYKILSYTTAKLR